MSDSWPENIVVLTPYLLDPRSRKRKSVNVGDGFILRAMERLLGVRFPAERLVSPRIPFRYDFCDYCKQPSAILIAGANQLNDNYRIVPGLTANQLRSLKAPIIPFAIGLHGLPTYTRSMTEETRQILRGVHESITFSSWRCPLTIDYLAREIPEIRDQLLMTGCAAIYDRPLLDGTPFSEAKNYIAVTVTERDDFWHRESLTLQAVADQFYSSERFLIIHQDIVEDWGPRDMFNSLLHRRERKRRQALKLREYARSLGYQVVIPADADAAIDLYRQMDMHFGSRLHAHLLCLSLAKRSFLTHVDDRASGMASAFQFPLCDPARSKDYFDWDFEVVRRTARQHHSTMQRFISSMAATLSHP